MRLTGCKKTFKTNLNIFYMPDKFTTKNGTLISERIKNNKLPILIGKIQRMYNCPLNIDNFQAQAQKHYKTSKIGNLLRLECKTTKKVCTIDFSVDFYGYIRVQPFFNGFPSDYAYNFKCLYNRDLFIKLKTYRLI